MINPSWNILNFFKKLGNSSAFPKIAEMDCFADFFQTWDPDPNWDFFQEEWQDVNMNYEAIEELYGAMNRHETLVSNQLLYFDLCFKHFRSQRLPSQDDCLTIVLTI